MSFYYGFPEYVPVSKKKERAKKSTETLRKTMPDISPIVITGRKIASTWWGMAWNDNLEKYADYANRIDRGRSYVRHGSVVHLKITEGRVTALVQGSEKKPYQVDITILPLSQKTWESMIQTCEGKIESLQELLTGKFPKSLAEMFTAVGSGLFPAPKEIGLKCSCPDSAKMCKHVAATLYGVGARLDENPALFFQLRNVNIDEMVSKAIAQKSETLIGRAGRKSGRVIAEDDLSSMFGITLDAEVESERQPRQQSEQPEFKQENPLSRKKRVKHREPVNNKTKEKMSTITKTKPTKKSKENLSGNENIKNNENTKSLTEIKQEEINKNPDSQGKKKSVAKRTKPTS